MTSSNWVVRPIENGKFGIFSKGWLLPLDTFETEEYAQEVCDAMNDVAQSMRVYKVNKLAKGEPNDSASNN